LVLAVEDKEMGRGDEYHQVAGRVPASLRRRLPLWLRRALNRAYWRFYDLRDYVAESVGWLPSHRLRLVLYRHVLGIRIGQGSSVHRGCRFYRPPAVKIGAHVVINRDVLLDGRRGLTIGDHASISEGVAVFTLEHDPNSPSFAERGGAVQIGERAFVGARALLLPGVTLGEGAVVGAGAVVTRDVEAFTIVGGVPARVVGQRRRDLGYSLHYRKFLG
jgi:acetyltransferase-like isoleucine patch superfamily enzyme